MESFFNNVLVFRPATLLKRYRSSHQRCSIKRAVLKNFAMFTGKHLCRSPCNFLKKRLQGCFFCEYCEIFKNTNFEKHLRTTASENTPTVMLSNEICEILKNTYFWTTETIGLLVYRDCFYLFHLKIL